MNSNKTDSATSNKEVASNVTPSIYERNKLRIAGALNGFGDLSLLLDGYTDKYVDGKKVDKTYTKVAGWLYTIGAAVITLFGSVDKDKQIKWLFERTAEFLKEKSGNNIASESKAAEVIKNQNTGFIARTIRYLQRNAAQAMLWFYTLGAGAMLAGGLKGYGSKTGNAKKEARADMMVGGFSLLVKGASFLLPEKSKTVDVEKKSSIKEKGIVNWLKEKPMRLFGYGSMLTEAFWGYRAYQSKQSSDAAKARGEEGSNEWKLRTATGASYAASDVVIATTNKDAANTAGKMDDQQQNKLEEMVAETIANQSEDRREELTKQSVEFLEKQSGVNGNADELRQSILKRVEKMTGKSWSERSIVAETMTENSV